ncbi:thiamine-phosphate kinase [Rhodopirellula baltica]|uniref:Thiamine-monophosphate kinase n=1 Tax=Rhodopirellula baltica SWK14 TaxID=993516 RepID=L7CMD4_RHOBT|nr:thiamine-phosphate kinase [Rhodopirellula baltica]ELP35138.1 thiamine-monophosphate kinase [Rhodopirellula baltica SWK14]
MEQSFLAYLRGRTRQLPQVAVGIGDDAAVIDWPGSVSSDQPQLRQVACTDQILDGVDFRSEEQSLSDIGFKAMAINLSDIAAMGATPSSALVTLALPAENATEIAGEVYEGILEAAQKYQVAIAGGDLSTYDGPLSISITILGWTEKPWLRTGAEEGDALFVTGALGGSLLGRHLRPEPRVELAAKLKQTVNVHAAIDVSDGFSLDLDRMLAASRMGAELELETLPISQAAHQFAEKSGRTPLEHAWSDGEDFELVFCVAPEEAAIIESTDWGVPVTRVGKVVGRTGLWKRVATSKFERVFPQGFVHGETDVAAAN